MNEIILVRARRPFTNLLNKRWATLLAISAGGLGGWLFDWLNVPLGWLVGSMLATGILALSGFRPRMPGLLRWMVMTVIGIYLGAAFSPGMIDWIPRSIVSIIVMLIIVTIEVFIATWLFTKWMRCNAITAYAACMPGGFSTMLLIAQEHGGNAEIVSMVQLVRMVIVIFSISLLAYLLGVDFMQAKESPDIVFDEETYGFAMAVFLIGLGVGILFKLPILCMVVPAVLIGFSQVIEISDLKLHKEPLSVALVLLGASVGSRWGSLNAKSMLSCLVAGFILALFLVGFSFVSAWLVADTMYFDLVPTIMAYSPGGVSEITLIAIALDIEPAYVGLHHTVRIMYIMLMLPLCVTYIKQTYMTDENN